MLNTQVESSKLSLKQGSKSFHFASLFFPEQLQTGAAHVYHWCRHCDDLVDENVINIHNFPDLVDSTLHIWDRTKVDLAPPFLAMREAVLKHTIPKEYLIDLLLGMKMDLSQTIYRRADDLDLYCYRVAGTVGLMMCHIMGIYKIEALAQAVKLGMAMQMTNIARDVSADHRIDRLYLPEEWLEEAGLTRDTYMLPQNRPALLTVVNRLLGKAESYYRDGMSGIQELPGRAAFVIMIAATFYREIGREISRIGITALDQRVVVSKRRKFSLLVRVLYEFAVSLPKRLLSSKKPVDIDYVWRPS